MNWTVETYDADHAIESLSISEAKDIMVYALEFWLYYGYSVTREYVVIPL